MMETTEEIELPDISPDLEDSGESEEAAGPDRLRKCDLEGGDTG